MIATVKYGVGFTATAGLLTVGAAVAHRQGERVTWRDVRMVLLDSVLWLLFWGLTLADRRARKRVFRPRHQWSVFR